MQGRSKTNQPRHEYEDVEEGIAEAVDLGTAPIAADVPNASTAAQVRAESLSASAGASAAAKKAGGRGKGRVAEAQAAASFEAETSSVSDERAGASRGADAAGIDASDELGDDAGIDDESADAGYDADTRTSRVSQLASSVRERGAGWLERLRQASGGMLGNFTVMRSVQGSDGEDVDLEGHRVAVLAADGVEKVELTVPVAALRAAGAEVDIVSLREGRIRSVNLHEPASRIRVDLTVLQADPDEYDALLIPGGLIGPDLLRQSAEAREFVRAFDEAGKPIASICHGVWLLASAGIAKGRTMTSWPGVRDDMVNAGATWLDEEVVIDRNWVTSRGPHDLREFVPAMLSLFAQAGEGAALGERDTVNANAESAPQADEPPSMMLSVLKGLPRPSLRTAAMLGVIGAAVLASRAGRR